MTSTPEAKDKFSDDLASAISACSKIQIAADTGNIKEMHNGIKRALGPTQKKSAPPQDHHQRVNQELGQTNATLGGTLL